MLIAVLTAIPMMAAAMVKITDVDAVMNSVFPAVELLYQATGNHTLTVVMAVWLIIVYMCKTFPILYASLSVGISPRC
jgi:choline transport protein